MRRGPARGSSPAENGNAGQAPRNHAVAGVSPIVFKRSKFVQYGLMNSTTAWHTIREASMISGLPESTLRYYEQIGIIGPIARDPSSGHRAYADDDLESLTTVSCLAATGMPLDAMREYLRNRFDGPEGARRQVELLDAQSLRLAAKAESIRMQQAYVSFKTLYWRAIAEGRSQDADRLLEENHDIVEKVKRLQNSGQPPARTPGRNDGR